MPERFEDDVTQPAVTRRDDEAQAPESRRPTPRLVAPSTPRTDGASSRPRTVRFEPGALIAGRYRLVALLGKGGMGEVYRAEDLTLDQPVALKFLPEGAAADGPQLAMFHNELRVARQVSHKNVCRLYDLGEAEGRRFLTMEYVDGEDLASLLRRIGRIPQDKAIEMARQLCAGLAAAHAQGVLHRDLKPANVMIDGEGNVRLTDFGIAVAASDANATLAGTPQYMAPEQLKGSPASVATDIYALGLVLFELFTGKRAHSAKSIADIQAFHETGQIATPTTVVKDLDPAVERTVMRCLDRDPARRPHNALVVAAGLPGHDPIAAALAAGETPSPDLLSAAAETGAMPSRHVLAMATAFVLTLALFLGISRDYSVTGKIALPKPPAVMLDRADRLFEELGFDQAAQDRAYGTYIWNGYESWALRTFPDWRSQNHLRHENPEPILLWYRRSPRALAPLGTAVTQSDPPLSLAGMLSAWFEMGGGLIEFAAVPPAYDATQPRGAESPNWAPLFAAANLSMDDMKPAEPQWTPRQFADHRAAWVGNYARRTDIPIRVEAASYRGQPIAFRVIGPWNEPENVARASQQTLLQSVGRLMASVLLLGFLIGAIVVARYNIRQQRADYRGARRLAFVVIYCAVIVWLGSPHGSSLQSEIGLFGRNLAYYALYGAAIWAAYVAIEPFARRYWPDGLLGWSRLFAGHIRDTRVGGDVLRGLAMAALSLVLTLAYRMQFFVRGQNAQLFGREVESLAHPMLVLGSWAESAMDGLFAGMAAALVFVLARQVLRRDLFASLAAVLLLSLVGNNGGLIGGPWPQAIMIVLRSALTVYITVRFGLLVLTVAATIGAVVSVVPMTLDPGAWYSTPALITLGAVLALLWFAINTARSGQPLFSEASPPSRV